MRIDKVKKLISVSILIVINIAFASTYSIPECASSVSTADIDSDGDIEIVVGHSPNFTTNWSGISTLYNDSTGLLDVKCDSLYIGATSLILTNLNSNQEYDIITQTFDGVNMQIGIWLDYYSQESVFQAINLTEYSNDIEIGDIDGDGNTDIVFYSNRGDFWGYIKNDGTDQYSEPEYHNLEFPPCAIACGDINGDGKDDVAVGSGGKFKVYLKSETDFEIINIETIAGISGLDICDIDSDGSNEIIVIDSALFGEFMKILIFEMDEYNNFYQSLSKDIDESLISFVVSDINDDGYPDIIYNDYENIRTYILYNEEGTSFLDAVSYQTYFGNTANYTSSIKNSVSDIDGNGLKDIVTVNYSYAYENDVTILFQDSTGNFVQDPQTGIDNADLIADKFELLQNYPNPFNNETQIQFNIEKASLVELCIYNSKGDLVRNLTNQKYAKGRYTVSFKADQLTSGVYYYDLKVNNISKQTKKMLYLR